ncbi:MAG: hypothetical protein JO057_06555 [Chloroflexi bacterium]|nr:hypothetical protein [Chloroflexota bacterium]
MDERLSAFGLRVVPEKTALLHPQKWQMTGVMAVRRCLVLAPVITDLPAHRCQFWCRRTSPADWHDDEDLASYVNQVDGPLVLVGHFYRGAITPAAGTRYPPARNGQTGGLMEEPRTLSSNRHGAFWPSGA